MAITTKELRTAIGKANLKVFKEAGNVSILLCGTENFRHAHSPQIEAVQICVALEEDGELIKVFAPWAYIAEKRQEPVLQILNEINWKRKLVKASLDPEDGEVRFELDIPIEESEFDVSQLLRAMAAVQSTIDDYHHRIRAALKEAEINDSKPTEDKLGRIMESYLRGLTNKANSFN